MSIERGVVGFQPAEEKKATLRAWVTATIKLVLRTEPAPVSIDALHLELLSRLPDYLQQHVSEINRSRMFRELDGIFWKGRANLLSDTAKARLSATKLHALLGAQLRGDEPVPPLWVVEWKLREMHGKTSAPRDGVANLRGILRVDATRAPVRALLKTSDRTPHHALAASTKERLKVAVIAGPQMGLPYDQDIHRNLTRCGFSAARKLSCDAIVLGGGLFRIIFQKTAGPNRLVNDVLSGIKVDISSLAENYREEARQIVESGSLEPLFITAAERFADVLRGWYKVTRRPDGRPEFTGPVYVVLNSDDIGLVRAMTYFELLYKQHGRWLEAEAFSRLKGKLAAEAYAYMVRVERSGVRGSDAQANYDRIKAEAEGASMLANRIRMTNLESEQNIQIYKKYLSFVVTEIEKNIPNAVVIGQDAAFVKFGGSHDLIKFVSSGDASAHLHELGSYGPVQRKGRLPNLTVTMHPGAVYMRKTSRENYLKGSMLGTVSFVEAPILVDRGPILEGMTGQAPKLLVARAVTDPMFNGGMLLVTIDPVFGSSADVLPAEAVRALGASRASRTPAKRVWLMVATDPHIGGANRVFLRRDSGVPIGFTEAAFELMARFGMDKFGAAPVAGLIMADDLTQGNHFDTHLRPHHNQRSNALVLNEAHDRMQSAGKLRSATRREFEYRQIIRSVADQIMWRPSHHLGSQLTEFGDALLSPYRDVFKGILLRAKQSGVVVRGIGDLTGKSDMRDVGIINFGSGNHATATTHGTVYEGTVVAAELRAALRHDPDLRGMNIDSLICAPLFQDRSIGYGTIRVGDGFEWGLHISGTPPRRDSWLDVLAGWVKVNRQRGNPSSVLDGRPIVHITGDKHFFASCYAGGDVYVMGPSSTHTDAFAEIAGGLPENNAGLAFIGLPVGGPDVGEITAVHLTPSVVQGFLTSGERFPWEALLPNRA